MAIKRFAGDKFSGLSTDSKPTNILIGATFYETDTSLVFQFNGTIWAEIGYVKPAQLGAAAFTNDYNDLNNLPDLSALQNVENYANFAAFPVAGANNIIYVADDTGFIYRWNGSAYVQLTDQTAVWGSITGTLSNQTDLSNALGAKIETASNVGSETGVFKEKVGVDLRFKSLKAGTNVTFDTTNADVIEISSSGGGGVTAAGAGGDVQYNDGAADFAADSAFNYDATDKLLLVPDLVIKESGETNVSGGNDEAVYKVTTENISGDIVVRVMANIGNGDNVIIASYIDPA